MTNARHSRCRVAFTFAESAKALAINREGGDKHTTTTAGQTVGRDEHQHPIPSDSRKNTSRA